MAYSNSIQSHSNVYNYYMTTYAPKSSTPYDTHKKSELRSVYNSIVKMNKDAPIYILDTSKESCAFAVGMKENARELRNTIAALGNLDEDELLNKKAAYSSNENIASASYIGKPADSIGMPSMDIEVRSLATSQVNMGNYLPSDEQVDLPASTYSFDISIDDLNYEFQFNIKSEDTNGDLQERLTRLINNANIGLFAQVIKDGDNQSGMRLESNATGLKNDKEHIFNVSDHRTSKDSGTVEYLGLGYTTVTASNADFLINGVKTELKTLNGSSNFKRCQQRRRRNRLYRPKDRRRVSDRKHQYIGTRIQFISPCSVRVQRQTAKEQPSRTRARKHSESLCTGTYRGRVKLKP